MQTVTLWSAEPERPAQTEACYADICRSAIGLHPENVKSNFRAELAMLEQHLESHAWVAIGEVGMDLYWDKTYASEQQEAFTRQVEWAVACRLPLIIHCRKAHEEVFRILQRFDARQLRGVFHCFSGSIETARQIMRCGHFVLGIGGVLTFKNSSLRDVLHQVPLEHIVLETDAPYLAPVPHRGERNESSMLTHVVNTLADVYQVSRQTIENTTSKTAQSLFCC